MNRFYLWGWSLHCVPRIRLHLFQPVDARFGPSLELPGSAVIFGPLSSLKEAEELDENKQKLDMIREEKAKTRPGPYLFANAEIIIF